MNVLQLRKEMFPAIFSGKKTSTSRQGIRPIVPQQELRLIAPNESVSVDVLVTSVNKCKFDELTIEEAIKEGYSSLEELKDTLKVIYDIEKDDNFTIIEFKLPWDIGGINENEKQYVCVDDIIDRLYENEFSTHCPLDEVSDVIYNTPSINISTTDLVVSQLNELKKKCPDQMIVIESMGYIVGCPIGYTSIYKNQDNEIIINNR